MHAFSWLTMCHNSVRASNHPSTQLLFVSQRRSLSSLGGRHGVGDDKRGWRLHAFGGLVGVPFGFAASLTLSWDFTSTFQCPWGAHGCIFGCFGLLGVVVVVALDEPQVELEAAKHEKGA